MNLLGAQVLKPLHLPPRCAHLVQRVPVISTTQCIILFSIFFICYFITEYIGAYPDIF